jgi:hypothetical protein
VCYRGEQWSREVSSGDTDNPRRMMVNIKQEWELGCKGV